MLSTLINDLNKMDGKELYQELHVQMGIECSTVVIPLKKVDAFIVEATEQRPTSIRALRGIVAKFAGMVK